MMDLGSVKARGWAMGLARAMGLEKPMRLATETETDSEKAMHSP